MKYFDSLKIQGYSRSDVLFINYFWLISFSAIIRIVTGIGWVSGLLLPIIIYWCLFFDKSCKKSSSIIDGFWWLIFVWDIVSLIINDYPHSDIMAIRCITTQIAYMMAYWIVRKNPKVNIATIVSYGYLPFIIVCIIGFYCWINPPSWYINTNAVTNFEEMQALRFRSIFSSSYNISYFGAILLMLEFFIIIKGTEKKVLHYSILAISLVSVFLTTQRAPIASVLAGFGVAIFYTKTCGGFKNIKNLSIVLGIGVVSLIIIISNLEYSMLDFMLGKYDSMYENDYGYIQERLLHNKGESTFSLIGDGVGRYNMYADLYPPNYSKRDGEYIKLIIEQGYIGVVLNILFWGTTLIKSIFNFKNLSYEFCILIMLSICMIGANPLSTVDKYSFIYWMAAGQIANYRKYGKNKIVNSNSNV